MGIFVREAVAQEKSFRGNCMRGNIPGNNCPGEDFIGVVVWGNVVQERNFMGEQLYWW